MVTPRHRSSALKQNSWKAVLLAGALSLLIFGIALAAAGDYDSTFGVGGHAIPAFSPLKAGLSAVAVHTNGKIVVVGSYYDQANTLAQTTDFAVARLTSNGLADNTFSGDGRLLTNFGAAEWASDVAILGDGKVVVVGNKLSGGLYDVVVARYTAGGALDTTFSSTGKRVIGYGAGTNNTGQAMAMQSDGKIVIVGRRFNGTNDDFAVYRLLGGGAPDNTFSGDGRTVVDFGASEDASDVLVQPDGKIVVVGSRYLNGSYNFAVARLKTDGSPDTSFSADGQVLTNFGANDRAQAVAILGNGKILVSGEKCSSTCDLALARYNTNGGLDTTFSGDGKQLLDFPGAVDNGTYGGLAIQSDGKIVVSGYMWNGLDYDFALYRLLSGGAPDNSFSGDGRLGFTYVFPSVDQAFDLAIQGDGKYLVAGTSNHANNGDFPIVYRLLP